MSARSNCFKIQKAVVLFCFSSIASLLVQMLFVPPAKADCEYEGKRYQTGETVGPYVCMPSGNWSQE